MTAVLERPETSTAKPVYHNLVRAENAFPNDVLKANPHFNRLVELCSQAFERSRIQVYQNGDEPYIPADKQERQYFTLDPFTKKRVDQVPKEDTQIVPSHIQSANDDGAIYFKQAFIPANKATGCKKRIEYWQTNIDGVPLRGEDGRNIVIDIDPTLVIPQRTVHKSSGLEVKAYTEREILREEIGDLVAYHFRDLIKVSDQLGTSDEWANAYEVAPVLIGFMTDKKVHIEGVQKSHALNMISAALQIARNPNTRVKIVAGFGASDREASNCYVGNALPALQMADNIRGLTNTPMVELVFATEAGIEANFQDQAEKVRAGMAEKMRLVANFASTLFPEVRVVFNQDIPWSNLTPETLALINYRASLILQSPSHPVQRTLDDLVHSGYTKGTNGSTRDTAAKYSSIHDFVWGMKPDFVQTQYLKQEIPADIVIRIGPRTEANFDAMIMAIKGSENREGFIAHVLEDAQQGNLVVEVAEQIVTSVRTYTPEETPTIVLITSHIGEHGPTYFTYDYDHPAGHPIEDSMRRLREEATSITGSDLPSVTRRAVLSARVYDLQAIMHATTARLALMSQP